ncbi:pseudouridine synthase [Streptomyces tsukubensis]|uniref:RNA pseudouridylate synthase n=1 Tax=Streptomyces tsukubensis TaxID=83656 RepID=A0A1V4AFB9_9ACTN|nr:pseudouridine synthase [Streptomyces tsukubensis]OON82247.1 pseudouridylate synthase [Streptomyces tsukubensis]QFR92738.1 pseudouridylate synthase [Streptomyces tsukubensis]
MRRRRTLPISPLAQRRGIDATRIRLPADGAWRTVRDHLVDRLPVDPALVDTMLTAGDFVRSDGAAVRPDTPYAAGMDVWFHRDPPPEVVVPFAVEVVYRDAHIVVADTPHFLATTPRGSHVTETALARLRTELGLPALSPAHRLDRMTAGLVLFTVRPAERGAYQTLFSRRLVTKEYEAVAAHDPGLVLPRTVRSRIEKFRGLLAAQEVPGPPNAETRVELADHRPAAGGAPALGFYRLTPVTGRTHQLRVHMNALGVPLLGDPVYPEIHDRDQDDFSRPLQLLARSLEFTDPLTGREHRFVSGRRLAAWDSFDRWALGREEAPSGPGAVAPGPVTLV